LEFSSDPVGLPPEDLARPADLSRCSHPITGQAGFGIQDQPGQRPFNTAEISRVGDLPSEKERKAAKGRQLKPDAIGRIVIDPRAATFAIALQGSMRTDSRKSQGRTEEW
jgi:hypothetical protein